MSKLNSITIQQNDLFLSEINEESNWQYLLEELPSSSTYMTWMWGDYKSNFYWRVKRFAIVKNKSGHIVGCFQLQIKKTLSVRAYVVQGGIHLNEKQRDFNCYSKCLDLLESYIRKNDQGPWVLFIDYKSIGFDYASLSLMTKGYSPIVSNRMFTYLLPLWQIDVNNPSFTRNWKKNLKRAIRNDELKIHLIKNENERRHTLDALKEMYQTLSARKNFKPAIDLNIASDLIAANPKMIILQAVENKSTVAVRVASVCQDHVLDFLAASNIYGYKCYANYLLIWEMIKISKELGKQYFDTGGINPRRDIGVFNFKKGLNGKLEISGPIWARGSNRIIEYLASNLIAFK